MTSSFLDWQSSFFFLFSFLFIYHFIVFVWIPWTPLTLQICKYLDSLMTESLAPWMWVGSSVLLATRAASTCFNLLGTMFRFHSIRALFHEMCIQQQKHVPRQHCLTVMEWITSLVALLSTTTLVAIWINPPQPVNRSNLTSILQLSR